MFYSDNWEFIDKTKKMLHSLWENSPAQSPITLEQFWLRQRLKSTLCSKKPGFEALSKAAGVVVTEAEEDLDKLTENDIISRILNAQKPPVKASEGVVTLYSCNGQAIIHPPSHLSLPDMLVYFVHAEKHSTFGTQDFMHVVVWRETPVGYAFVPSAFVYDKPEATEYWSKYFAGVPSGSNLQLVKNEELQVQLHGNILFACWTVPITLIPGLLTLPPGCIKLEGYGNLKTEKHTLNLASGYKMVDEFNGFDAFVTFLHPSSKYSGPGTDGFISREVISNIYPPPQK